jgi:BCD family chlorophyll transporter-like MFS transporter
VGLWGAAQAIAFGAGGLIGATASDVSRMLIDEPGLAYGLVFFLEAALFVVAAWLATRIHSNPLSHNPPPPVHQKRAVPAA